MSVEKFKIGEVDYEAIVDLEGGHYYGRWVCISNGQHGNASAECRTPSEAIRNAKMNAGAYHGYTFNRGT